MVLPRRWLPLAVLPGIVLLWLGQWHIPIEWLGDSRRAHASACRSGCGRSEPRAAPIDALRRLAAAETARRKGAAVDPQALAELDLRRLDGLFAIAIVDREYGLRWVQTRSSAPLSVADLQSVEQACDVLLRRPIELFPTVVDRRKLRAGGPGFVMAVPVLERDRVASFVVGLFRGDGSYSAAFSEDAVLAHP